MKYLSFSLWGDKPIYNIGAIKNAELWKTIYPEWKMVVYYDSTVPKETIDELEKLDVLTFDITEKKPISNLATVGYYYWKNGSDFVKYAEEMINNNIRVNNEFYVCPVFNQAIKDKKKIKTFNAEKMWGLGTPEDLKYYLENKK